MLTSEEKADIRHIAERYEERRGASVEALKLVQRWRGWVSNEDLEATARILDMSPDELDGVATFYNLIFRRPVGWHVILFCDSISCWIMGCNLVRDQFQRRLCIESGETTKDGYFTLLPTSCLGACDHAPALMIDADLHRDVSPEMIDEILSRYT